MTTTANRLDLEKQFSAMLEAHDRGDLNNQELFEDISVLFANALKGTATISVQTNSSEDATELLTAIGWHIPVMPHQQKMELLGKEVEALKNDPGSISLNCLASKYGVSVPTVSTFVKRILPRFNPQFCKARSRQQTLEALRPGRIFNFARLWTYIRRNVPFDLGLTKRHWMQVIIDLFNEFEPLTVDSSRFGTPVAGAPNQNLKRGVRYNNTVVMHDLPENKLRERYYTLINNKNFMDAWMTIEAPEWMKLGQHAGYVRTDCLLNGPALVVETMRELAGPNIIIDPETLKSRYDERPQTPFLYKDAKSIKELMALGASNLRRANRASEEFMG